MKTFFRIIGGMALLPLIIFSTPSGVSHHPTVKGIMLVYVGNLKSPNINLDIDIHVEMVQAIGLRYEVVYEKGDYVVSHMAIFHKFSQPNQAVYYNFLTHKSMVNKGGDDSPADMTVSVVGKGVIDKYACTHLQYLVDDDSKIDRDDYWMSENLPGFQTIVNTVNQMDAGAASIMINGTVFQWGGLVKYSKYFEDKQHGEKVSAEINLMEANTDMEFPVTNFDVPKK